MRAFKTVCLCTVLVWAVNAVWLVQDSRPPVWDMALHQSYALNYTAGFTAARVPVLPWDRSGNYPPFVHLAVALFFTILHPSSRVAILANIPATFLLFWAVYELAADLAGNAAARWACVLTALVPYLLWMSRETILDYWLSAWFCASLVWLRRTKGFESPSASLLLGALMALGLLTKWLFAGLIVIPFAYVFVRHRVWKEPERTIHCMDCLLVAGAIAGVWYLPNLPKLIRYFSENTAIGALEGEPPVLSFQSMIYYLRLLEGYQYFAVLFALLLVGCVFVSRMNLLRDGRFLAAAIGGGWLAMTLLRTKDPRFTMPLLGPLTLIPAAWIQSWKTTTINRVTQTLLVGVLVFQAYAINFGVSWLPQRVVLAGGYHGSLNWSWNLYLQDYFDILGPPRHENWKQAEILRRVAEDARRRRVPLSLALVPDLPRFNSTNFQLQASLMGLPARIGHLQSASEGIRSFDGYEYVLMSEGDQGMSWSTSASRALNQIIVDEHEIFRLVELYPLPNGAYVRLYFVQRDERTSG